MVAPGALVRVPPTTTTEVSPAPPAVPTRADGCSVTSAPMPTTVLRTVPAMVALPPKTTTLSAVVPAGTVTFWSNSTMLPTDVCSPPAVAAPAAGASARIPRRTSTATSAQNAAA